MGHTRGRGQQSRQHAVSERRTHARTHTARHNTGLLEASVLSARGGAVRPPWYGAAAAAPRMISLRGVSAWQPSHTRRLKLVGCRDRLAAT